MAQNCAILKGELLQQLKIKIDVGKFFINVLDYLIPAAKHEFIFARFSKPIV